jgi:hypothetical protein
VAAAAAGSGTGAPHITLIATDVDGTLLDSKQQLSPGNEAAIKQAAAAGVPVSRVAAPAATPRAMCFCHHTTQSTLKQQ